MNNTVIILGSSRTKGDSGRIASYLSDKAGFDLVNLKSKNIQPFDYEFKNNNDDFFPLIENILNNYDTMIFITPVYWYSMSGIMKNFIDRFSDLLKIRKETGRKFRGKNMAMISCSGSDDVPDEFSKPFIRTAEYLGMNYLGDLHTWIEASKIPEDVQHKLDMFIYETLN